MFTFLQEIVLFPLLLIGRISGVKKNIWLFGSWSGRYYNDNTRYLYNYILENNTHVRPIWITKSERIRKELLEEKKECYKFNSLKGVYYSLVSGVIIVSDSWGDLPVWAYFNPRKKIIVQLWHGTLLRKVNFMVGSKLRKAWRSLFIAYLGRGYDLVISATQKNKEVFSGLFNAKKFVATGQPRIDGLFTFKGLLKESYPNKKIIVYLPTWRDSSYTLINKKNKFDFDKINNMLKKQNAVLVVKIHPYDIEKYKRLPKGSNIDFRDDLEDIYMYLSDADILLTDYSSVYFDYLILNRPIVFAPFDLKEYGEQHGFYYDYNDMTPGPKAMDWDEVVQSLKRALGGEDNYKNQRVKMNKEFNKYHDDKNSYRTYKEILKLR